MIRKLGVFAALVVSSLAVASCGEVSAEELAAIGNPVLATTWIDSGVVALPGAGAVLVDTGAQSDGDTFTGCISLSTTLSGTFDFEHRNAANNATLHVQRYNVSAAAPFHACFNGSAVTIADGERLRVVNVNASLGTVSASMFHQ